MAQDLNLYFHGTSAAGATFTPGTTSLFGPTVDLGSATVNRTIRIEKRVQAWSGTTAGGLTVFFQDSSDGTSFTNMPGSTGSLIGFVRSATSSYSSTDAVAADAAEVAVIRTDKRYVRAGFSTTETTQSVRGITLRAKVLSGAWSGASGVRDV